MRSTSSSALREEPLDNRISDLACPIDKGVACRNSVLLLILPYLLLDLCPRHVSVVDRDANNIGLGVNPNQLQFHFDRAVRYLQFRMIGSELACGGVLQDNSA